MIKMTKSMKVWLLKNHPELYALIGFGHLELFTEEMAAKYIKWCKTDEGKQYLQGGAKYERT